VADPIAEEALVGVLVREGQLPVTEIFAYLETTFIILEAITGPCLMLLYQSLRSLEIIHLYAGFFAVAINLSSLILPLGITNKRAF